MIELYIEGQAVDIAPDTKITLSFNSNLFGDISKITASNSFTIALPKTPKNSNIFGLPSVIGGASDAPYRRWNAQLFVNGVSVIDTAYAMMLSVGDTYDIALYWGVVTALSNLKEGGKSLKDLSEVLEITYGGENWWNSWEGAYGRTTDGAISTNLINAVYESGIEDLRNNATARAQVALLPSVNASWLWDNIVADNGLTIEKPSGFTQALSKLALPFTTHKTTESVDTRVYFTKVTYKGYTRGSTLGRIATFHTPATAPAETSVGRFSEDTIKTKFGGIAKGFVTSFYEARMEQETTFHLLISLNPNVVNGIVSYGLQVIKEDGSIKETKESSTARHDISLRCSFKLDEGDKVIPYLYHPYRDGSIVMSASLRVIVDEDVRDQIFGGLINTRDNLPDIKQLDFVKALCAMYGLWATLVDGEVHLQSVADFYNGAHQALDWSHKLIGSGDGDAKKTTYTLADYVQRNTLRYKADETVKVDASGTLIVENNNLDNTKDMLTLPFSASDGNIIPHLLLEDGKVKEEKVQPRIMLLSKINDNGKWHVSLDFDNFASQFGEDMPSLRFSSLLSAYYGDWQRVIRNPIVIEEQMNLSEIDIKELDYRKPIYLQKYGARFAVQKVQWSEGDASVVTLVYLPPKEDIAVAMPYKVTTGVTFGSGMGGAVDPNPSWAYLVSGAGDYFAGKATLTFDEEKANRDLSVAFAAWTTEAGAVISTGNPFVYDGSNGDMVIYANTVEVFTS